MCRDVLQGESQDRQDCLAPGWSREGQLLLLCSFSCSPLAAAAETSVFQWEMCRKGILRGIFLWVFANDKLQTWPAYKPWFNFATRNVFWQFLVCSWLESLSHSPFQVSEKEQDTCMWCLKESWGERRARSWPRSAEPELWAKAAPLLGAGL